MSGVSGSEDERADDQEVRELGVRVKLEKVDNQWAAPLYAEEPTLLLDLENPAPISRKSFEEFYGLCNKGPSLKRLKIGRDVTEAEVENFFGPCNGKNSYRYNYHEDETIIQEVERLWMICHQRTVLPYNRSINKAEARGFALWKRDPSVPVNWCVFAEWPVRDRLRRLQRVEAKKLVGGGVSEGGREEHDSDRVVPTLSPKQDCESLDDKVLVAVSTEMAPGAVKGRAASGDMILEWTELLSALETELGASDAGMKLVSKRKERCGQELLRCSTQLTDREHLLEGATAKLAQIEGDLTTLKAELIHTPDVSLESLPSAGPLLRSFHSYVDMVQTFTEMFEKGERDHAKAAADHDATEIEWDEFARQRHVLAREKVEVQSQLRLLKAGYELTVLHPRPPCFARSGSADYSDCCVISQSCSYCLGSFAPEWNCTLSSCKHGYHSWCAKSWFANSRKCCFPSCGEEMHSGWWSLFGLPKPESTEEESKLLEGIGNGHGEFSYDTITPSTSVSVQQAMRQTPSRILSPSVGSRVFDVKTTSLAPLKSTSPVKKRKEGGMVQETSAQVQPLLDKKRKGAVKKCLSPTVEATECESEEVQSEGSSDEDSSEDAREQLSPGSTEPGSQKRKSMGDGRGQETRRAVDKKKSRGASFEGKKGTSNKGQQLHGAAGSSEQKRSTSTSPRSPVAGTSDGDVNMGKSGKKLKTPVSERVSMARTTRNAATKSKL